MRSATLVPQESEEVVNGHDESLASDPRWQLIERIAQSDAFQKSSRLPALLRYLARHSLAGNRNALSEQAIGHAVLGKPTDYTPADDSSVRVYIRQLRLRLHEFYHSEGQHETLVVDLPKGAYALAFHSVEQAAPTAVTAPVTETDASHNPYRLAFIVAVLAAIGCAAGWIGTSIKNRPTVPWPLNSVVRGTGDTTVVLADVGYSLRMLGGKEVSLEEYIDRSFITKVMPKNVSDGEARLLHYLAVSQTTSMADADAAAGIAMLAGYKAHQLVFRSARDINAATLTHGDLIFVGARTSNPWVEVFEKRLNFRFVESAPGEQRYIVNEKPLPGEQTTYTVPANTGSAGEDYATISLLPGRGGSGNVLIIQGLRMEGTAAAVHLLRSPADLQELQRRLTVANGNRLPQYFEVLIHAQSVGGAPVSVDFKSVRPLNP